MKKIFVVDDNAVNLLIAEKALSDHYQVFTMSSALIMFELLEDILPNLILLDIIMPELNGMDALEQLKKNERYALIPVIFLTSKNNAETEALGFQLGAVDFIRKPFSGPILLSRIKSILDINDIIRERTAMLEDRTERLVRLQGGLITVMANMVERADINTGEHIENTAKFVKILLNSMLENGLYIHEIKDLVSETLLSTTNFQNFGKSFAEDINDPYNLKAIILSSRLHDIGKIAVPENILKKPGKLTKEEYEIMKTHVIEGEKIIDNIIAESGDEAFLRNARLFASSHHEKWDGTGYPYGLKGEEIPLHGRIMAIADVYDALISIRPYKKAYAHEKAVEIICDSGGSHFDPQITDLFMKINSLFLEVSQGA